MEEKLQTHLSQQIQTHKRHCFVALKLIINKVTKADTESVRIDKNELQNTHLNDFKFNVSEAVEKIRELVVILESNSVESDHHIDDVLRVFKDKSCSKISV